MDFPCPVCAVSLFADLVANDRPLVVRHDDGWFFPVFTEYPETDLRWRVRDGDRTTGDPFVVELIEEKGWMIWPPIRYRYDTFIQDLPSPAPSPPDDRATGWEPTTPAGTSPPGSSTDSAISVLFGLTLTLLSSVVGIAAGAVQGYFGGWIDLLFQRFIEVWSGMPVLFLLIILASLVTPNFWWLLGIMLLFSWMGLVGVVRAEFLRARNFEYVRAARALGVGNVTIMFRHLLPNAMVATLTFMPFILNRLHYHPHCAGLPGVRTAAGLSFSGRAAGPGQGEPAGALAGRVRVHGAGGDAEPPHLHRRSGARRL